MSNSAFEYAILELDLSQKEVHNYQNQIQKNEFDSHENSNHQV